MICDHLGHYYVRYYILSYYELKSRYVACSRIYYRIAHVTTDDVDWSNSCIYPAYSWNLTTLSLKKLDPCDVNMT